MEKNIYQQGIPRTECICLGDMNPALARTMSRFAIILIVAIAAYSWNISNNGWMLTASLAIFGLVPVGITRMIEWRKQTTTSCKVQLESILRVAPIGIGITRNRIILEANDTLCRLTGYSREELIGHNTRQLYCDEEDYQLVGQQKYQQATEDSTNTLDVRWRHKNGITIDVMLNVILLDTSDPSQGIMFTVLDITERKRAEELLKLSEARYQAIVEKQADLVCRFLPNGTLTFVNSAYCRYFGRTSEELLGTNFSTLIPEDDRADALARVSRCGTARPSHIQEHRATRSDGAIRWIQWRNEAILDADDALMELQGVGRDVTEQRAMEIELRRLATTDPLTGTFNRRHLHTMLDLEVERARRHGRPLALIMFDLDHFKRVNDNFGHEQGDQVLRETAARVRGRLRRNDVLARWGGEEFLILAPETTGTEATTLAETLRLALREGLSLESGRITASFGVTAYRPNETVDQWLGRTDERMYASKRQGRDRVSHDGDCAS